MNWERKLAACFFLLAILCAGGIKACHAAERTLAVYGAASLKVCDARAQMKGKAWKAIATFIVEAPACPRPQRVTLCLFR